MIGFVDVEAALVGWLSGRLPAVRVCTDLPADLQDVLPVVQVVRGPGGSGRARVIDVALVDVDVYAADRAGAVALSNQVRGLVLDELPADVVGGAVVLETATSLSPSWRPYDDMVHLRRFGASYWVTTQIV